MTAALSLLLKDTRDWLDGIFTRLRLAYHQIFGIPDYQRYLAHMADHHPEQAPLSRQEFCARAIERKYGRSGAKCC